MTKTSSALFRTFPVLAAVLLFAAVPVHPVQADDHAGHMRMTATRPARPGDEARADAIVAAARRVAVRYTDYRKALADGYQIFLPDQKQPIYHFMLDSADEQAKVRFDPDKPSALLYEKTGTKQGTGYKLVGVMYTDRADAGEKELDARIPLSIAQWHEHVNLCVPADEGGDWLLGSSKFGLNGSIADEASCRAAGGLFKAHLSGWMTHVYPFETTRDRIWAAGMGDEHMPGMKM